MTREPLRARRGTPGMTTALRSACVAVLMLLLATTAAPAVAKGPAEVAVAGPGVDRTLNHYTHSGLDVDLGSLSEAARIFDIYGAQRPQTGPDVAEEALGARYVLTWDLGEEDVVQHAYPFAEGGAWVHLLPGQELFGEPMAHGWSSAPALTEQLVGLGAVDEARASTGSTGSTGPSEQPQPALATVEPEAAPVAPSTDESDEGTPSGVVVPAAIVVAALLGAALLVARRRSLSR